MLSWLRKAAQKLSQTASKAPEITASPYTPAEAFAPTLQHLTPKRPPTDTDAVQQCPRPPADVPLITAIADISAAADVSGTNRSSPPADISEPAPAPTAPSPAVQRLRALRQRAASPEAAHKRRSALHAAAPDSASSLNSARGARGKDQAARRRTSLAGMDLGAILLSPDKAACLAFASTKVRHTFPPQPPTVCSHPRVCTDHASISYPGPPCLP